ncbi:Aste57867_16806 [Aphanomyces stellatus]|uniref:Aste57867_16806 protein n=1 Tax=Aphanomyces stellatus TaxID=120398 RepID=A0A485L6E9_9STRA|nr:hypothetical protein As57867_016749 [Aphanomyces stellatus]VFT93571.1 Aste57867_16806 [Aphanomyces stellatus]
MLQKATSYAEKRGRSTQACIPSTQEDQVKQQIEQKRRAALELLQKKKTAPHPNPIAVPNIVSIVPPNRDLLIQQELEACEGLFDDVDFPVEVNDTNVSMFPSFDLLKGLPSHSMVPQGIPPTHDFNRQHNAPPQKKAKTPSTKNCTQRGNKSKSKWQENKPKPKQNASGSFVASRQSTRPDIVPRDYPTQITAPGNFPVCENLVPPKHRVHLSDAKTPVPAVPIASSHQALLRPTPIAQGATTVIAPSKHYSVPTTSLSTQRPTRHGQDVGSCKTIQQGGPLPQKKLTSNSHSFSMALTPPPAVLRTTMAVPKDMPLQAVSSPQRGKPYSIADFKRLMTDDIFDNDFCDMVHSVLS